MKTLIANPDNQLRALEWAFGTLVIAFLAAMFAFGWVGNALDGLADWYSGLFTTQIQVADVTRPPDTALEGYVPGEPLPGRTNPDS